MRAKTVVLAVDIGTSATKAVLFDEDAQQHAVGRRHYAVDTPRTGWAEQDPAAVTVAVIGAIKQALEHLPADAWLAGVVFSSQLYSVLACTPDGTPLSASLTWSDTRGARAAAEIRRRDDAPAIRMRTGCPIDAIYPLSKIVWLRQHLELPASTRFVSIKEYVLHHLTGEWLVDWSVASATGLFDIQRLTWDEAALEAAGIDDHNLSALASPRHHALRFTAAIASELKLPPDTPVVMGGGDGPLASIGVGSLQTGALAINVGTSAAARLLIPTPFVDPSGRLWTYVADEGLWVEGGIVSGGGIAYEWALRAFFGGYLDAEASGVAARVFAERLADAVPPGAENLLFVPYLGGEQCPAWNPDTRGAFMGLDFRHAPGHFMRAVLEGITRSIYLVGASLAAARQTHFELIRTTGGVSTSPLWLQIAADMFGIPISVPESAEGSARGAAVIGLIALGMRRTIQDFPLLTSAQKVVEPRPEVHALYLRQSERFKTVLALARTLDSEIANPE